MHRTDSALLNRLPFLMVAGVQTGPVGVPTESVERPRRQARQQQNGTNIGTNHLYGMAMSSNRRAVSRLSVFASLLALVLTATASKGQTASYATPRVQGVVNEAQLSTLKNNVLPMAQPRFDRGSLPAGTPSGHMLM